MDQARVSFGLKLDGHLGVISPTPPSCAPSRECRPNEIYNGGISMFFQ